MPCLHNFFAVSTMRNLDNDADVFFGKFGDHHVKYAGIEEREVAPGISMKGTVFHLVDNNGNNVSTHHGPSDCEELETSLRTWWNNRE